MIIDNPSIGNATATGLIITTFTSTGIVKNNGSGVLSGGNSIAETEISFTNNTTNDVSITKHGYTPKAPNDTSMYLRGDGTWAVVSASDLNAIHLTSSGEISTLTEKTSLVDADVFVIEDSADTYSKKKVLYSTIKPINTTVRNTVFIGKVDTSGLPSALAAGSGLAVDMDNTPTAAVIGFAGGYNNGGAVDYIESVSTDQTINLYSSFTTHYLFFQRVSAGNFSAGRSSYPYHADTTFIGSQIGSICATFEGLNTATSYTDLMNNVATFSAANAEISTTQYKSGSSSLRLKGTNGYVRFNQPIPSTKWTQHCWFRLDAISGNQTILSNDLQFGTLIYHNGTRLIIHLTSATGSWTIANGVTGTKTSWTQNQWYHLALVFDGTCYRVFVDGTIDAVISSSATLYMTQYIQLGYYADFGYPMTGYIDNYEFLPYALWTADFVAPTTLTTPSVHWLNTNDYKMYYGNPASWSEDQTVYIGQCESGRSTSDGNISSPNLRISGTTTQVQTDAFYYQIASLGYYKAAVTGQALTATTVPQNKWGLFGWEIGVDGTIHSKDAAGNAAGYTTETDAINAKPAPTASHILLGYITVMKSDGNFVGATTALNAANTTVNYYNSTNLAAAVSDVRTYAYNGTYKSADVIMPAANVTQSFSHNMGTSLITDVEVYGRNISAELGHVPGDIAKFIVVGAAGVFATGPVKITKITAQYRSAANTPYILDPTGNAAAATASKWKIFMIAKRGF
jgi:hypothetical protein